MYDYFFLDLDFDYSYCVITGWTNTFKERHKPAIGKKLSSKAPKSLTFRMSDEYQGIKVGDFVLNTMGYFLINEKVKNLVDEHVAAEIEYIPFSLKNHKDRKEKGTFFIMNIIGSEDCVDREKTKGKVMALKPERYQSIQKLVLDNKKIPEDKNLFRISAFPKRLIIRSDLKDVFEREAITGIKFLKMGAKVDIQ